MERALSEFEAEGSGFKFRQCRSHLVGSAGSGCASSENERVLILSSHQSILPDSCSFSRQVNTDEQVQNPKEDVHNLAANVKPPLTVAAPSCHVKYG